MKALSNLLAIFIIISMVNTVSAMKMDTIAKFDQNVPGTLLKRTGKDQQVLLNVKYLKPDKVQGPATYTVEVSGVSGNNRPAMFVMPDIKLTFGDGYPESYPVIIKIKGDTSSNVLDDFKIKLTLIDPDTALLDEHNIFYQEFDSKLAEKQFLKSTEDIRSDINSLKTQILDGDTSQTYIGKFIIKKSGVILSGQDIKNFGELDSIMKGTKTKLSKTGIPLKFNLSKIKNVVVTVADGLIEYIKVTMDDNNYFTNMLAPIQILDIQNRFTDKLINPTTNEFIFLSSAIDFISEKRFNFFPSNGTYTMNNDTDNPVSEMKVFANSGLNSFVDLRVFTDLLGTLDNQPNGLLQIEAKSKIFLHRMNFRNKFLYSFYALEPSLNISKFDSKYDTIKLQNPLQKTINRMDLFQRSFLSVGLKLNLLRYDFRPTNSLSINGGYMFHTGNISIRDKANLKDSIVTKGTLHSPYAEFALSSKRLNNFGFDGEVKYIFQKLNENKYFINSDYSNLLNFSVTMFFYPGTKPKDKFFVRFSNYLNFDDRTEDFYQLQFGYSLNLKL